MACKKGETYLLHGCINVTAKRNLSDFVTISHELMDVKFITGEAYVSYIYLEVI
jgi:hypothetical protein